MSVASRIKEARESAKLTQEALAKKLGVSKGAVGNYETGVSYPKTEILLKLFEVLDIDANYLYQDDMPELKEKNIAPTAKDAIEAMKIILEYQLGKSPTLEEAQSFERSVSFFCEEIKRNSNKIG